MHFHIHPSKLLLTMFSLAMALTFIACSFPTDLNSDIDRGYAAFDQANYNQAIEAFDRAVSRQPTSSDAYFGRAISYAYRGDQSHDPNDYQHAIDDYTRSIRLNPNNASAYSNRGFAYHRIGEYDLAIADC